MSVILYFPRIFTEGSENSTCIFREFSLKIAKSDPIQFREFSLNNNEKSSFIFREFSLKITYCIIIIILVIDRTNSKTMVS